ncbi:MAG: hypothetical protein ACREXX_09775 [Gammaproteobacteria bacterium]
MKRILGYMAAAAGAGATLGVIFALLAGAGAGITALIALLGAATGAVLGFFIGSAVDWFSRLKEQNPRTITITGKAVCTGRNPFGVQPFSDGDWTCNIGGFTLALPTDLAITAPGATNQTDEVRLRAAADSGLAQAFPSFNEEGLKTPILHCELSALAGTLSVVGGAVGSVVGLGIGIAIGLAICAAIGIFTFGIGAALCALIVALAAAIGSAAGGVIGDVLGAFIGWLIDEISDFDKLGETIESNTRCTLFVTGRWVTDISHEHNEIHDIEAVQLACPMIDVPKQPQTPNIAAIVAIGRQPAGGGGGDVIK